MIMPTFWTLSLPAVCFAVAALVVGGVVRGYSGFGAAMVWASCLSLVLPPASVVPSALMLEVAAGATLLPRAWRDADRPSLRWLLLGTLAGLPVGIWLLASLPQQPMRLIIGVAVGVSALAMAVRHRQRPLPGRVGTGGVGVVFGVLNGACGVGGPPVVLMYMSAQLPVAVSRASLVVFFLVADVLTVGTAATGHLLTFGVLTQTALFLPIALVGVVVGGWLYRRAAGDVRRIVLCLLALLSATLVAQAVLNHLGLST